jgi:HPt (histidine-containing phosphotransfer) domain-containing protein
MDSLAERLRFLRQGYLAGLPARLVVIRAAQKAGDRTALQLEAHRLAGTGVSYGAPMLSEWGQRVERKCKSDVPLTELADEVDILSHLIDTLPALPSAS